MTRSPRRPTSEMKFPASLIHAPGRTMVRGALMFGAIFVALFSVMTLLELPFTPWARSLGLWRTLTGDWTGELRTEDGRASPVFFEIRGGWQRRSSYINGRARLCDSPNAIRNFEIHGGPDNWRGTRFHLSTRSGNPRDGRAEPAGMRGEWSGDVIQGIGEMVSTSPTATAWATRTSSSPSLPKVVYTLHRGSEEDFLAACSGRKDGP